MYRHFKTEDYYEVISEANSSDDLSELIVYRSIKTGKTWVRSKAEFYSEAKPGILRFTPINNNFDFQYMTLVNHILTNGRDKSDRTGKGTRSITSYSFNIDISELFPLLTVKRTFYRSIFEELIWFLRGSTDVSQLKSLRKDSAKKTIWCDNSSCTFLKGRNLPYKEGYIGPAYGYQWRGKSTFKGELQWCDYTKEYIDIADPGIDQIQYVINEIKNNPDSRRILISNWDVNNISNMALPPCHILFQIVVRDDYLDGIMYQRSADLFLGVPFNVASYSALLYILARVTNKKPGIITIHFGDVHIYSHHIEQAQLLNTLQIYDSPTLHLSDTIDIDTLSIDDFKIKGYKCGPYIEAEMAI